MKIFIAYKFRNVNNKEEAKKELEEFSDILEEAGNKTFILGRDTKSWESTHNPAHSKMRKMNSKILESDAVFAFIRDNSLSFGLLYELHFAFINKKPITIFAKKGVKTDYVKFLTKNQIIEFVSVEDIKGKI